MELKDIVQFMINEQYMVVRNGKYCVTQKFYKSMTGKDMGVVVGPNNVLTVREPMLPNKVISWESLYQQFIMEAKVPKTLPGSKGSSYDVNQYDKMGMLAFKKAMEVDKVDYRVLVNSTQLYYQSSTGFKVKISRYMGEGLWRTGYQELFNAAATNTVDDLVNEKTQSNEWTSFKLG